jgi:protease I
MHLDGKRFVVLVEELYEDQELWYPARRLAEAGAEVMLVGPEAGATYKSKHGYPAKSEKAANDVAADDLDGLIIPGGYAPDRMRRHKSMVDLVRNAYNAGKIVAAICHAGWMLCSAGVLKGKNVTSFSAIRDDMVNAGASWVDRDVVQDENLITSRTPDDLPAFMRAIIAAATGETQAEIVAERSRYTG